MCVRGKYEMNETFAAIFRLIASVGRSAFVVLENENDGSAPTLVYDGIVCLYLQLWVKKKIKSQASEQ